ncbi:MAG TPA: hypothetical protein PK609_02610 [Candidatus Paceibacterota bacterium]|nr:hypothetical protein [Candidatus Paceibacterota bacterium]
MAHHAYLYIGDQEPGIRAARAFAESNLNLSGTDNPDIAVFAYEGLFPIVHARRITQFASQAPSQGDQKVIVIAAGRFYHEAQNALLKTFEEPPEGTTLILVAPAEGTILPTLRSRLIPLPREQREISQSAQAFLAASSAERTKLVAKLLARAKSDKEEEKQAARLEAVSLVNGLTRAAHDARKTASGEYARELDQLLLEFARFAPILHERAAPLKPIFEHILIVLPQKLGK